MINLLLASGNMPWVDVCLLKVGKDQFTGSSIITVRTQQHIRELELGGHLHEVFGLMVLGAVNYDHRVLSPCWSLPVQLERQRSKV